MAFVRPAILVYQEFQNATVAPGTPDLNCCIVGPAYYIQDYTNTTDKPYILAGKFVKSPYTTGDAPCLADGTSAGKPDNGTSFLTLANPPNHIAGGVLDAASVQLIFDDLYVDLQHGTDGAVNGGVAGGILFDSASGDFEDLGVLPGDRLVMTKGTDPGVADHTVIKTVSEVVSGTQLKVTSTFKDAEVTALGASSILWRVEHQLDDTEVDKALYTTIVGNSITVKTGSSGIRVLYADASRMVNFGKIYIGYRELRTNLQSMQTINSSDAIEATLGRVDERNPLATGVFVAMSNTGTPIQAYGVESDDLAGHQSARDSLSARDDVYAIVPVTDQENGLTEADWVSVISMWKAHCVAYAAYDKAKFRVVLGSYETLPTEKSSAPPSTTGYTLPGDPSSDYDVFVDPAVATAFVTAGVTDDHLLDVAHATYATLETIADTKTIFSSTYGGAKTLRGAIGEKRIRTTAAKKFSTGHAAEVCAYTVREPILRSEGATPKVATTTVALAAGSGGDSLLVKLTKTNAFGSVAAGDVVHVQGCTKAAYNGGWLVKSKTDASNIVLYLAYDTDDDEADYVDIYTPAISSYNGDSATGPNSVTKPGAFANVAADDLLFILRDTSNAANVGLWVITNVLSANSVRVSGGADNLLESTGTVEFAVFSSAKASNGNATVTVRQRLTRLRDDAAHFMTTVTAGEDIEIPYPAETDSTKWDTSTTQWKIDAVVSDELLDADLDDLEELAPESFIAGYNGDCSYRVNIDLSPDSQIEELNTITASLANSRCLMVWPNACSLSGVQNELTGVSSVQSGQYLACGVGGMVAGMPSHQGFTFLGLTGVSQIYNSNQYFTDDQLTDLRDGGWYVFVQESAASLPYTIHEVTTDVTTYESGEFMFVKNLDFVSLYLKDVAAPFLGKYNITTETLSLIKGSLEAGLKYLQLRIFPRIGTPVIDGTIERVEQNETETDRIEVYASLDMPKVVNRIALHLLV